MIKPGVFAMPKGCRTNLESLEKIAELGLNAYEPFNISEDLMDPEPENAEAIRKRAEKLGVELPCFSVYIDMYSGDAESVVRKMKRYADAAKLMGIPMLHHTIIPQYEESIAALDYEQALDVVIPRVQEVYDYAESIGVRCVYEEQGTKVNGVRGMQRFFRRLDRPAGVVLDIGNCLLVDETALDIAKAFCDRIVHVHIKDMKVLDHMVPEGIWMSGNRSCIECRMGEGDCDISETMNYLKQHGYNGWCMMECAVTPHNIAELMKAVE